MKNKLILIAIITTMLLSFCKEKKSSSLHTTTEPMAMVSNSSLIISIGKIYDNGKNNKHLNNEAKKLIKQLHLFLRAIINHNELEIIKQLPTKGKIYIDLKAPVTRKEIIESLKTGNLNRIFWQNVSKEYNSYQEIFSQLESIEVDFFFEGDNEVELNLKFENRPSLGIMSNPIYHKKNGKWKIMRFF